MSKATYLQKTAELCRRVASIPTSGGYGADRALLALAGKLDHEVAALEDYKSGEGPIGGRVSARENG